MHLVEINAKEKREGETDQMDTKGEKTRKDTLNKNVSFHRQQNGTSHREKIFSGRKALQKELVIKLEETTHAVTDTWSGKQQDKLRYCISKIQHVLCLC